VTGQDLAYHAYSTRALTRSRGTPTWTSLVHAFIGGCRVQPLGSEDGFVGRLVAWQLGCLQFVRAQAQGIAVRAIPGHAGGPSPVGTRSVWLGMCLAGGYEMESGRHTAQVKPSNIAVLDGARLPTITFAPVCDLLWVKVPRVLLPVGSPDEGPLIIDGTRGTGCLAQITLRGIAERQRELELANTDAIVEGVIRLVSAAVTPSGHDASRTSAHRARALRRVKQHVERNLGDDALSMQSVADALGLSARYINKLFESERTSLMRWTWSRRLEYARIALSSGGRRAVGEVACAFGYKNAAHFSRVFRAKFGRAPSSVTRQSGVSVARPA
jgi:AraC family transcriptional regulator, positive regulator of tynA and feaB